MTDATDDATEAKGALPWELHPALQPERLRTCALMLANARRDAIALASYDLGDDPWSVGCRSYAFGRHRLRRAAEAGNYPWLRLLDGSHHFVFLIERVPVRFYRGEADSPSDRTLRRQENEAQQLKLALGPEGDEDLFFRFAVETDARGQVARVVFLALRGEDRVECFWPVPLDIPVEKAAREGTPAQLRLIADDGYAGPGADIDRIMGEREGKAFPRPPRRPSSATRGMAGRGT